MKTLYILSISFILGTLTANAQAPQFAWAKQFGKNTGVADASVLAIDSLGNSYMAGVYPTNGIVFGSIALSGSGSQENSFIAKFDPSGNALWAKRIKRVGGFQEEKNPDRIAIDMQGNVYLCGMYLTGATIDDTPILGNQDYFITKFNSTGNLQWIRTSLSNDNAGSPSSGWGYNSIHINQQQEICMTGLFNTSISFDGNTLTNNTNQNGVDAFLVKYNTDGDVLESVELGIVAPTFDPAEYYIPEYFRWDSQDNLFRMIPPTQSILKYDSQGSFLWQKQLAITSDVMIFDLAIDPNENIFLAGLFYDTMFFEGDTIPNSGSADAFITKLDDQANLLWTQTYQTYLHDKYSKIKIDGVGNLYALGRSEEPTLGTLDKIMITKFSSDGQILWDEPIHSTFAVIQRNIVQAFNGGNILIMGTFKQNLTFNDTTVFTTAGGPFDYKIFLAQYGLCNASAPTIISEQTSYCAGSGVEITSTQEDGYLWSNGDTANPIIATEPGEYYVFSNDTLGCYAKSNIIYIEELPLPNDAIAQQGIILSAIESNATYQWIDCGNNQSILGATEQSFTPDENGEYAVIITNDNNCSVTSQCISITTLSINENTIQPAITLYPNPVINELHIQTDKQINSLSIFSLLGQKLLDQDGLESQLNVESLASGIYLLQVSFKESSNHIKFIKQ